ncbi:unnamed protein product, partial [Durusdinium trenchii]
MESDSAAEDLVETVATEIPYSATWPEELQRYLLKRGVEDYVIQDRFGAEVLGSVQPKSFYRAELFPLRVIIRARQEGKCLAECAVIKFEEVLLRLRSFGATGAGLEETHQGEGFDTFAVAFGGGGVRSGAFCSGVLWALAETNRLQHVTHLSSVSGGSIAASGFASFLVEAHRAAGASPSRTPSAGPLYREVVADFIERSQRNAGYLVSFQNLFQVPEDNSSSRARIWDLPLMFLVVLGVLVAAPSVFCVFYVVPVTMLIEAYWGGAMRHCFCRLQNETQCNFLTVLQARPENGDHRQWSQNSFTLLIIGALVLVLMVLALIYKCCGMKEIRHSARPRWFLHWRSLTHLCTRWLAMFVIILATVSLVYTAELVDYRGSREEECLAYFKEGPLCSDNLMGFPAHLPGRLEDVSITYQDASFSLHQEELGQSQTAWNISQSISRAAGLRPLDQGREGPNFIVIFLFLTLALALVSLSFKFLGWSGLWRVFLFILLPLWFIWPASFLLQWRVFGPITRQALFTPFFDTQIMGRYTDEAWYCFTTTSLLLAIACLPAFNLLHRFVHFYFRVSLQRAFYHDGVDVLMPQVSKCPWVPILLFGATLNEFMRPNSKEAHSLFTLSPSFPPPAETLSQYAMGCQRTDFLAAPKWMSLARCMTLSCAAIDGFVHLGKTRVETGYRWRPGGLFGIFLKMAAA